MKPPHVSKVWGFHTFGSNHSIKRIAKSEPVIWFGNRDFSDNCPVKKRLAGQFFGFDYFNIPFTFPFVRNVVNG